MAIAKAAKANPVSALEVIDIVDELPKHPYRTYSKRSLGQVRYLVIHHSASSGQSPETIARFHSTSDHLTKGGAAGIAYHFYIREDGSVYQTQALETISWHVSNNNTPSIGICLSGNLEKKSPTAAQKRSVVSLVAQLKAMLPTTQVKRHGEFKATTCPGKYMDMRIFNSIT